MLVALRDARLQVRYLDDIVEPLDIEARRLVGNEVNCIYAIRVGAAGREIARARVTILARPTDVP
jgi:hypothetical protein